MKLIFLLKLALYFVTLQPTLATEYPNWLTRYREELSPVCQTDEDCLYLGECINQACKCNPGFKGSRCHELDLLPTDIDWGFRDSSRPSWGGMVIYRDGQYHLFASYIMNECDLISYGTNSAILRATSEVPQGPYKYEETVLPPFHHGVAVVEDPHGQIFLWTDGKNTPTKTVHNCISNPDVIGLPHHHVVSASVKHGLYKFGEGPHDFLTVSTTINFRNWNQTVVLHTNLTAEYSCNRTNPSPLILEDGSVLLAVRTTYCSVSGFAPRCLPDMDCQHIFLARSKSPTSIVSEENWKQVKQLEGSEDPFLWKDSRGRYHILAHSKRACGKGSGSCGLLASSGNGVDWKSAARPAFTGHVKWRNGEKDKFYLQQRPKILFDKDKTTPLFLITGVRRRPRAIVQTLMIPFNVPSNAHLRFDEAQSTTINQEGKATHPTNDPTSISPSIEKVFQNESKIHEEPEPKFIETEHSSRYLQTEVLLGILILVLLCLVLVLRCITLSRESYSYAKLFSQ